MNLRELLFNETTKTRTENGALAYSTTKSAVLDLFAIGGAGRNLSESEVYQKVSQALSEDLELGIRCLLFLGDIRGGQGERRLFKIGLKVLINTYPQPIVERVLSSIPFFTRWDYVLDFIEHPVYGKFILKLIHAEITFENNTPDYRSLIYKWLPSIQRDPHIAIKIARHLGLSNKEYRQMLSKKRNELKVTERLMSDKRWDEIDYSQVPAKASLNYREAFKRHDEDRYSEFLNKAVKGEVKINSGTLYPHELVSKLTFSRGMDQTVEAQWKNLPDFVKDKNRNILPMVDVSGSMGQRISNSSNVTALNVSIGLGIYLAERLEGEFKDTFLTFSTYPELVKLSGKTLHEKVLNMSRSAWNMSTDINAAFDLILNTAVKNNLKQEELPETIVVFSDMEFDDCAVERTPYQVIETEFNRYGYKVPQVIFWNLNARNTHFPVRENENGVTLVSGYSPSTLQYILSGEYLTPYEVMLKVLSNERYNIFD